MTVLFYSPLSTWAPEALCDMCVCVCAACLCVCSAVHALQRGWEEMRDETGECRRHRAELSPRFIPACSVTCALWYVAVLNHRAIIWCQAVQRPQTSVMVLLRCTVSVSLSSMQLLTITVTEHKYCLWHNELYQPLSIMYRKLSGTGSLYFSVIRFENFSTCVAPDDLTLII